MSTRKPPEATQEEWDAAQRLADAVNLHVMVQNEEIGNGRSRSGYVAVQLSDGRSPDGILYDRRQDAVRHQIPRTCLYVKVGRQTMTPREAWVHLNFQRAQHKLGVDLDGEETILPQRLELATPYIPRTIRGALRDLY